MASKLSFLAGLGVGYLLGARSGRERYDQIIGKAQDLWHDPRVQEKAEQAQQAVKDKVGEKVGSVTSSGPDAPETPGGLDEPDEVVYSTSTPTTPGDES